MFLFAIVLLTCGMPALSWGQAAPTVEPGDDDTSLRIEFTDSWGSLEFSETYYVQYRTKTPQGPWKSECFGVSISPAPFGGLQTGTVWVEIPGLQPGTTYQVRYNRNTGHPFCPPNIPGLPFVGSGPWSEIGEGTTSGTAPPPEQKPDLVIEQLTVSNSTLVSGENFTLSATVTNEGAGSAAATTLRYYRSTDATISTSDTEVGTDSVSGLGANESNAASITLTAPTSAGTYYYGACVEAVTDESSSDNNCSDAVSITVSQDSPPTQPIGEITYSVGEDIPTLPTGSWLPDTVSGSGDGAQVVIGGGTTIVTFGNGGGIIKDGITYTCVAAGGCTVESRRVTRGTIQASGDGQSPPPAQRPDLVIESVQVEPATVTAGQEFRLLATLRNRGTGTSAATTVRYYRSTDSIISTDDTQLGTGRRTPLAPNGTIRRYLNVTAPTSPGTYYYGVCVDSVPNESDTANNCSAAVSITVPGKPVISTPSQPYIYWTDAETGRIHRSNLDGSNIEDLVTRLDFPLGIALDVAGGKMYWTDAGTGRIHRSNLDGSNIEDLVTGLDFPLGIALDIAGGKMYWTDAGTGRIHRLNLDGSNVEDLVTGLDFPLGIALDVTGGKMYWIDTGTGRIHRSNLDGSNVEDLVTGLDSPLGIALDVTGGKMYWIDTGTGRIHRSNLDGSNVEDLVTGLDSPLGIALRRSGWQDVLDR